MIGNGAGARLPVVSLEHCGLPRDLRCTIMECDGGESLAAAV